jgi:hypothetical protein
MDSRLPLDSPLWAQLPAAGSAALVVDLLTRLRVSPSDRDWGELWEQLGHQWTLYPVAYAALPHAVEIGREQGVMNSVEFLEGVGRLAAPLGRYPETELTHRLEPAFRAALQEVGVVAKFAARIWSGPAEEYGRVLMAAAALNGRPKLSLCLFKTHEGWSPELECGGCGSYLTGDIKDGELALQSVDKHMRPVSQPARVTQRDRQVAPDEVESDFAWLQELTLQAGQKQFHTWLRLLYGSAVCPRCGHSFVVMNEIARGLGKE